MDSYHSLPKRSMSRKLLLPESDDEEEEEDDGMVCAHTLSVYGTRMATWFCLHTSRGSGNDI
jgi:hypothetical protein